MSMCNTQIKITGLVTKFFNVTTAYYVGNIIGLKLAIFKQVRSQRTSENKI